MPSIYSLFQQKTYAKRKTQNAKKTKNTWLRKSADIAKTSPNSEIQNINPRCILGKVTKFHEIWVTY